MLTHTDYLITFTQITILKDDDKKSLKKQKKKLYEVKKNEN